MHILPLLHVSPLSQISFCFVFSRTPGAFTMFEFLAVAIGIESVVLGPEISRT
jgi:hypothetical protein